ncbi:putative LOC107386907-like protein, partial [Nothobranchius furzeri]
ATGHVDQGTMDAELQELRSKLRRLQEENQLLRETNEGGTCHAERESATERILYIPRERKCPVFRGNVGIGVTDWIEEVRASLRARYLSPLDQAYFVYDHLEGEAKEEIRYRPRAEREDPECILTILQELYGCSKSYVTLQEDFFSRKQKEGESLQEFSHALFCLMEKITVNAPGVVSDAAVLLRDQFTEHVLEPSLRRELKKLVRGNPTLTLLDVRKEAIQWEQEGQPADVRSRNNHLTSFCAVQNSQSNRSASESVPRASDGLSEIKEMLVKQQEQINLLSQSLLQLQGPPGSQHLNRASQIICRRCQKPGHIARNCRQKRATASQPGREEMVVSHQQMGN